MKLLLLAVALCGIAAAQNNINGSGSGSGGASAIACVGAPGNTVAVWHQQCQVTGSGAYWGCNNAAGCAVAADWVAVTGSGSFTYPGAGVANSTGSAWGTSYTVGTAASNLVQLNGSGQLPAVSAAILTNFPTLNQNTTGLAATATALASVPTLCSTGNAPTGVLANGNATGCASISGGGGANANGFYLVNQTTNAPTNAINLGALATGFLLGTVSASVSTVSAVGPSGSGNVCLTISCVMTTPNLGTPSVIHLTNADSPPTWNQTTTGTAAGLTTYPTLCSGSQFSQGLSSGSNNCGTPTGGGNVSNTGTPVNHQIGIWATTTTIGGQSTATIDSSGNVTVNSLNTGSTAYPGTVGSSGGWACLEGTAWTAASNWDVTYCDSTSHTLLVSQNNGPFLPIAQSLPVGAPTYTAGSGVTSCIQSSSYINSNARGELTIVGGVATTGTICTVNFSATLAAAPGLCIVTQQGGASVFGIGHGVPGTGSFTITSAVSVAASTFAVDYQCAP